MNWHNLIKGHRHRNGLKQEVLALQLGVNQATISRWERGIDIPNVAMQRRLRDLLFGRRQENLVADNLLRNPVVIAEVQNQESLVVGHSPGALQVHRGVNPLGWNYRDTTIESALLYEDDLTAQFWKGEIAFAECRVSTYTAAGDLIFVHSHATPYHGDDGSIHAFVVWNPISREQYLEQGGLSVQVGLMEELIVP